MTAKQKIVLLVSILFISTLACEYIPTPVPEEPEPPLEDVVATSVAATLAAADGGESPEPESPEPIPETPPFLRVAFIKNGDVWYWEEGGVAVALTALGDVTRVELSDDGQLVAFVREPDFFHAELMSVQTDGTNLQTLVSTPTFDTMAIHPDDISAVPHRIAWVPGTHILAFSVRLTYEGPGLVLTDELRLVDADTGTLSTLIPAGQGGDFYYSPNGSQIALVTATQISVVNSDGSNRRDLLTFPMVITYSEFLLYPPVFWSSGSDYLRAAIPPNDPMAIPLENTNIWHLPADGSPPSTLMSIPTAPFFQDIVDFSGDLTKIAYLIEVTPGSPSPVELHISNPDGSGDVNYETGEMRFEAFAPDGEHFIYSQLGSNPKIGRIGQPPLALSGISTIRDVTWIDTTCYLFLNRNGSNWELWLGELGAPAVLLGSNPDNIMDYDFTL